MSLTLIILFLTITAIFTLRIAAWRSFQLITGLLHRIITDYKQSQTREEISTQRSRLRLRFPRTASLIEARINPDRFTGLTLSLVVIAAFYIVALFGGLVEELIEADEMIRLDKWINHQLDSIRTDELITIFAWITDLGGSATLVAVSLVTTALLWAHHRVELISPLWLTISGSQVTTYAGKYVLARQRPEFVMELSAFTPSFPSGHTTSAVAVYGFIAYIIARDLIAPHQKFEIIYWTLVLIALIGFSRMFLSLHYASDIVAGLLVGSFWLLLGFALAEKKRRADTPFEQ